MSGLEIAWRAWQRLGGHYKTQFLPMFREAYREEREAMLAASRRVAGKPPLGDASRQGIGRHVGFLMRALVRRSRKSSGTELACKSRVAVGPL